MNEQFKKYFENQGFTTLTPIQQATQKALQDGKNVLGIAPTGSGKTLAYTWPLLEKVLPGDGTQLIILAPSQELAAQITEVVREWGQLIKINALSLIGGANIKRQIERLKKHPEVVVGTPGRMLQLIEQRKLRLHKLIAAVIDEADEMLQQTESMDIIRKILGYAPAEIQLSFFSATKAPVFNEFHQWFGIEPEVIDVSDQDITGGQVTHYLLETPTRKRVDLLRKIANLPQMHALVFFKQMATLEEVYQKLRHHHIPVAMLSSNGRQTERQQALSALKKGRITFILTTDIAARGIDIPGLPAVINYDIPKDQTTYIHRSGRTGRMGAAGAVLNLGNEHELRNFKKLMSHQKLDIQNGVLYQGMLYGEESMEEVGLRKKKVRKKVTVNYSEQMTKAKKKNRKRNRKNKGKPTAHKHKNK